MHHSGDDLNSLDAEIRHVVAVYEQKETEENWMQLEDALTKLKTIIRSHSSSQYFTATLKRFKQPLFVSLSSDRTRLARTGLSLVDVLAEELGERLDGNLDIIVPPVLRLCARANKVFVNSASSTLKVLIENARLASILPYLHDSLSSPAKTLRIAAADGFAHCLDVANPFRLASYLEVIEAFIRVSAEDSTSEVRECARKIFERYKDNFPHRLEKFTTELSSMAVKNLKITRGDTTKRVSVKQKVLAMREVPAKAPIEEKFDVVHLSNHDHHDVSDLKIRGVQQSQQQQQHQQIQQQQAAAGGMAGLGRRLLDRPTRVHSDNNPSSLNPTSATGRDTGWGAQRVLREEASRAVSHLEVVDRSLPIKSKALRVPSASTHTDIAPSSRPTSPPVRTKAMPEAVPLRTIERKDKDVATVKRRTKPAEERPLSISNRSSETAFETHSHVELPHDFSDVTTKLRNADWSVRFHAIDSLKVYCDPKLYDRDGGGHSAELRGKLLKIVDLYVTGLGDNHSKVASTSASGLKTFMLSLPPMQELLNSCLPRLVGALNQKQRVNFTWKSLFNDMKEQFGVDPVYNALLQGLQSVDFAKNAKIRGGCCQLLAEFTVDDWQVVSKGVRHMPHRLLTVHAEVDASARASIKSVLSNIHIASPELLGTLWATLKAADRRILNSVFGGSGIDRFVLDSSKRPSLARTAQDVRSPSPTSTTVNSPAMSPRSSISRVRRAPSTKTSSPYEMVSGLMASGTSMASNEALERGSVRLSLYGATSPHEDSAHLPRSGSRGSSSAVRDPGTSASNMASTKLSAAYEDSDTDWATDNEVMRSPTGSDNEFTLGTDNDDFRQGKGPFSSTPASTDAKRSAFFLEKPTSLKDRFGQELDENSDTLKRVEEFLSLVENPRTSFLSLHEQSVPPSAEAITVMHESIPKADITFAEESSRRQSGYSTPTHSSALDQPDACSTGLTVRGRAISQPLDENERLNRTLSLLIARENPQSIKESLKELRKMIELGTGVTIEALPSYLPKILTSNWETITSVDDDQLEIDYELDTLLDCIENHAPTDLLLSAFAHLDDTVVFESRPTFELLEKLMKRLRPDENPQLHPLVTCVAKGLDSANTAARKSAFDCAVHLLRIRPSLEDELFREMEGLKGKSRVAILRGMIQQKLKQQA
ncbi:hypothetical protein HDU67_005991 [Dinochytrium kinnereticum]|nr:hypothetical protein HDU67_005991 [Dinochytrium kinnereticum]